MTGTAIKFSQSAWQEKFLKSLDIQPSEPKTTRYFNVEDYLFPWNEIDSHQLQNSFKERLSNQTEAVRQILFENVPELKGLKNACLAFTGSDGRAEKLSPFSSPFELMFLAPQVKNVDEKIFHKIQTLVVSKPSLFHAKIEVKSIETHSLISYDRTHNWRGSNKDYRSFPSRALDATFLLGEPSIFQNYQNKFYEEVQNPNSKKRLLSFKTSAVKPAMQLLQRSTKGLATSDIDITKGTMTFNGDRIKATKQPLLRPVQYKVASHICKLIQEKKLTPDDLTSMPISIIDRIDWLAKKNLLKASSEQIAKVQKAYTAALIWAGLAQKNFEINNATTTAVPVPDLTAVAKAINDFCTDPTIFG